MAEHDYRATTPPGLPAVTIGVMSRGAGLAGPSLRISGHLRTRAQIADLVQALIDLLDATDDTEADLDCEELALLHPAGDSAPGDADDAEPSHGLQGWTWPAAGLTGGNIVQLRRRARAGAR